MTQQVRPPGEPNLGQHKAQLRNSRDLLEFACPTRPIYRWERVPGSNTKVIIGSAYTGEGDSRILLPFRFFKTDWGIRRPALLETGECTADIANTGVSPGTAGRADGSGQSPNFDYWVYAFANIDAIDGSQFIGYGIWSRAVAIATRVAGGAFGGSVSFTLAGTGLNRGWIFPNGSRVIIRANTGLGAVFNQGRVTGSTNTTLEVTLDQNYVTAAQSNAVIVAGTYEIIQLDNIQPIMPTDGQLYPGGGATPYAFTYVGHIRTDATSNVLYTRQRGDWYRMAPTVVYNATLGITTSTQNGLARWIPFDAPRVWLHLNASGTGTGDPGAAIDINHTAGSQISLKNQPLPMPAEVIRGRFEEFTYRDCSVLVQQVITIASVTLVVRVVGYEELNF